MMLRCRYRTSALVAAVMLALMLVGAIGCSSGGSNEVELVEVRKQLAGELVDSRFYDAAIEEYKKILAAPALEPSTRGNVNYLIARIYFDDLQDFQQAAAYYVRARALDPQASYVTEASRNLVACLEKLGRTADAKRQLDAATDIDYTPPEKGDVQVARVAGEPIWLSEIDRQIQLLPAEYQKEFVGRQAKIEFVRNYVGAELIYRAAVREGYENSPDIARQHRQLLKKLVVDQYVTDKVMPKVNIDTLDIRNYYLAHQNDRYNGAPFDSVQARVFLDYQNEKAEAAFGEYINELAKVEKVEFFEENVR
ncbi:MAG: hypothetical protein KAT79_06470 [candidate division Zixibacteria bacterium]|nr:hypothetical protein [candidate division Zixibacteria bacterium]